MKLALDIGNSSLKGSLLRDDMTIIQEVKEASAVVEILDEKYLNYTDDNQFYIKVNSSPLQHFANPVAIGDFAQQKPDYQEFDVTTTSHKTDSALATSLLFGTIAQGLITDNYFENAKHHFESPHFKIAVSIPIVESNMLGLKESYTEKLKGTHNITIYRKDNIITTDIIIDDNRVLSEGQAGFLGLLDTSDKDFRKTMTTLYQQLDENDDPISQLAQTSNSKFLIVDIGEGTTDIAVFKNNRFNPDLSYSVTKGYGTILEEAIANAEREGYTIESRLELQSTLSRKATKRSQERKERWENYVAPVKTKFIESVVNTILKAYGRSEYFELILFLGGGFTALTDYQVTEFGITMSDSSLFTELDKALDKNKKDAGLIYGIPKPYSQTINQRGLTQALFSMED